MDMNGMISSNNGIGNGLLENLELNYLASLESFDHHQVPLSLINRQLTIGLSAGHHHDQDDISMTSRRYSCDINGNLQPHPLQPPQQQRNYLVMGGAMPVHHFTPMQFRLHQELHSPNETISVNSTGEDCCICQEDYIHGEDICKLRCNHVYHIDCIKRWLTQKNFCPICKAPANQTVPPQQAAP
ncbi:RING finger protein 11-like [Impatiens glandulifera]|uniref:RING finger protein 11-like n=1 Tax=Impatiens glandulifera TaxID=253017 RepID=UPI001FB0D3CE|nr:RING finger protein 11-like [Impatiens glandulifera]